MDGSREEIPKWVWYTGQFLFHFQDQLANPGQVTVTDCFNTFKEAQQLQGCHGFQLKNQGTMLMLLYGLLVVPRGMWEHEGMPEFQFDTRKLFHFCKGGQQDSRQFLRCMRNAIAHANFEIINLSNGIYEFWNVSRDENVDFKVRIDHCGLGKFVTEVGQYYINQVAPYINGAHA